MQWCPVVQHWSHLRQVAVACSKRVCDQQAAANATHNADLLSGICGAGSVFGVVVEVTFQLYYVADSFAGHIVALGDVGSTTWRLALNAFLQNTLIHCKMHHMLLTGHVH